MNSEPPSLPTVNFSLMMRARNWRKFRLIVLWSGIRKRPGWAWFCPADQACVIQVTSAESALLQYKTSFIPFYNNAWELSSITSIYSVENRGYRLSKVKHQIRNSIPFFYTYLHIWWGTDSTTVMMFPFYVLVGKGFSFSISAGSLLITGTYCRFRRYWGAGIGIFLRSSE